MPCISSIQWIQYVEHCPRNSYEWDVRANVYNCSSSNQTCVSRDMFLYHCVLNADGTKLLEVCAPYRYINGKVNVKIHNTYVFNVLSHFPDL